MIKFLKWKLFLVIRLNFRNYLLTKTKFWIILHIWKTIIDVFKKLKKKKIISEKKYEDLYLVGSSPGILYRPAKLHEPIKDSVPSFRRILSAAYKPTYKLI